MTLTRRGKIVIAALVIVTGIILGSVTANWTYYAPHSITDLAG